MPISLGDLSAIMTPYTPPGTGSAAYSRALQSGVRGAKAYATGQAAKRAAAERARKMTLEESRLAESRRSAQARESYSKNMLAETSRSAHERERHTRESFKYEKLQGVAKVFGAANESARNGDVEGAKVLLQLFGLEVESPQDVEIALDEFSKALGNEHGLTQAEKGPDAQQVPIPGEELGIGPMIQAMGSTPGALIGQAPGGAPGQPQQPGQPAPLAGDPQLPAPQPQQPAYDPSQVPLGGAPEDMTREQFLAAEQAQEPAFAQQPALPELLPGADIGAQLQQEVAALEERGGMTITTPSGQRMEWNPELARASKAADYQAAVQAFLQGSDDDMRAFAERQVEMAPELTKAFGAEKAAKMMLEQQKLASGRATKRIGAEEARLIRAAKLAGKGDLNPQYERIRNMYMNSIQDDAYGKGYKARAEGISKANEVMAMFKGKPSPSDQQMGIGLLMRIVEKGMATEGDIKRAEGISMMSVLGRAQAALNKGLKGGLKPAHRKELMQTALKLQVSLFDGMQVTRNSLERRVMSAQSEVERSAYRDMLESLYKDFGIKSTLTETQRIEQGTRTREAQSPAVPFVDPAEIRQEAADIEMSQGVEEASKFMKERGLESDGDIADRLFRRAAGL